MLYYEPECTFEGWSLVTVAPLSLKEDISSLVHLNIPCQWTFISPFTEHLSRCWHKYSVHAMLGLACVPRDRWVSGSSWLLTWAQFIGRSNDFKADINSYSEGIFHKLSCYLISAVKSLTLWIEQSPHKLWSCGGNVMCLVYKLVTFSFHIYF